MTIAANQMKDAPSWATRFETIEGDESGGWFERDLTTSTRVTTREGALAGNAVLVSEAGVVFAADNVTGESFTAPHEMRALAVHLMKAADAWDKLRSEALASRLAENLARCMAAAGVDVASLSDRTEIPFERLEAILAATSMATMTDVMLFCDALDARASEMMPTTHGV
jgi:hypothetical protein